MVRYIPALAFALNSIGAIANPNALQFEPGTAAAMVYKLAVHATGPSTEDINRALEDTYYSKGLKAYEKSLTSDDRQDFDADEFTGTQDMTGVKVAAVTQTKHGADDEIVILYGNEDPNARNPIHFKVGYIVKQENGAWKIDDFIYYENMDIIREKSFRKMYPHPAGRALEQAQRDTAEAKRQAAGDAVPQASEETRRVAQQQQSPKVADAPGIPPAPGHVPAPQALQDPVETAKLKWATQVRSRTAALMTGAAHRRGRIVLSFKVSEAGDVFNVSAIGEPHNARRAEAIMRTAHMPAPPDQRDHSITIGVTIH